MNIDKAKELVRKMLATASNSAATEGEIDNALRFARKIMHEHNFGEGDVIPKQEDELKIQLENTTYNRVTCYSFSQGLTEWEITMIWAICELVGTCSWYISGKHVTKRSRSGVAQTNDSGPNKGEPKLATSFVIYGPTEDVRDAVELLHEWQELIVAMGRLKFGGFVRGDGRNYCEGFASGVRKKINEIDQEERRKLAAPVNADSNNKTLILQQSRGLMEARHDYAKKWLEDECGLKLSKGSSRQRSGNFNGEAYREGKTDGERANLSRNVKQKLN